MARLPVVTPDGAHIREVRDLLELSRDEVVARMRPGRHPKALHMIECGAKDRVSRIYMQELADALGRPVAEFIKAEKAEAA